MSKLMFGVVGTSRKENERRIPIHPEHLQRLSEPIRRQLIFEKGYGAPFGIEDSEIAPRTVGKCGKCHPAQAGAI
jgi:N5-(carboxyethyl)ornithine synthase